MSTDIEPVTNSPTAFCLPSVVQHSGGAKGLIFSAARGKLVPVVGFDAALLEDSRSAQHHRLRQAARRLAELQSVALPNSSDNEADGREPDYEGECFRVGLFPEEDRALVAKVRAEVSAQVFADYLPSLKRRLGWPFPKDPPDAPPTDEPGRSLICLELKIAKLAVCLTRIWARELTTKPHPLDTSRGAAPACVESTPGDAGWAETAWDFLVEAVSQVEDLRHDDAMRRSPNDSHGTLALGEIRAKLLRLVVEITGDDEGFWEDRHESFADDHREALDGLGVPWGTCGPDMNALGIESGIQSDHLVWLEALLEHLLIAGTGAYRTYRQFGFALSLALSEPPTPVRRAETALVGQAWWSRSGRRGRNDDSADSTRLVWDLLEECDANRRPSRFSVSLAALVQANYTAAQGRLTPDGTDSRGKSTEGDSAGGDAHALEDVEFDEDTPQMHDDLGPRREPGHQLAGPADARGWVLSTCLDLEIEKALALFGPYRVLLPTLDTALDNRLVWLIGAFSPAGDASPESPRRPDRGWHLVDQTPESLAVGEGPIVVKVYGSPLHELERETLLANDVKALALGLRHRLVVGEEEFMHFFQGVLPGPPNAPVDILTDIALTDRHVVFLGHDSRRWGDRAHYYGWNTHLHGKQAEAGGTGQSTTSQVKTGSLREAFGDTDALGGSLIKPGIEPQELALSRLASNLIKEFAEANPESRLWQ